MTSTPGPIRPLRRPGGALRRPRFLIGTLALLATALGGLIAGEIVVAGRTAAVPPRTATATAATVTRAVSATGSVVPRAQSGVGFRIAGQLVEVDVKVGDHVTKGQVLARIDPTSQQNGLASAQAAQQSAQAALDAAQTPLTPAQVQQLQDALANAQTSYGDTVAQVNLTNQQDATTVGNDQAQLASDQATFTSDGCGAQTAAARPAAAAGPSSSPQSTPTPTAASRCTQDQAAITGDQARLATDQNRQATDSLSGQAKINQASSSITAARDSLAVQATVKPNSVASAQAQLATAETQVAAAQLALDETTLTAPAAGVVTAVNGQPGENVSAGTGTTALAPGSTAPLPSSGSTSGGSSAGSSTAFITLQDTSGFDVVAAFAEADAAKLAADQPATVTFDALSTGRATGHVLSVASNATVSSSVVTYQATVALDGTTPGLRAGMTANLSVVTQSAQGLAVPNAAFTGTTVTVLDAAGNQVQKRVQIGLQGDSLTQVMTGLAAGDKVVLPSRQPSTATGTGAAGAGAGAAGGFGGAGGVGAGGLGVGGGAGGAGGGGRGAGG